MKKYCQHCKVQISPYSFLRKKVTEVPFVVQDGLSDDLLFCSTSCYLQMLLLVPSAVSESKVGARSCVRLRIDKKHGGLNAGSCAGFIFGRRLVRSVAVQETALGEVRR